MADREQLYNWFSEQRFKKFESHTEGDLNRAQDLYRINIQLSEALYPILSIFEVALRNAVHNELSKYYDTDDWFNEWRYQPKLKNVFESIEEAKDQIEDREEEINAGKLIAELTLGYWVSLFNASYELILWKPLRLCFKNMPKKLRQRHNVSANLNKIRKLRNRIYHYEPICWNLDALETNYNRIVTTLEWIDPDVIPWIEEIDEFKSVLQDYKK